MSDCLCGHGYWRFASKTAYVSQAKSKLTFFSETRQKFSLSFILQQYSVRRVPCTAIGLAAQPLFIHFQREKEVGSLPCKKIGNS